MTIQNVLFLVGSPKARQSTSEALGAYVAQQMSNAGLAVNTFYSHKIFRTVHFTDQFLTAYDAADLVLVAYPLYVDTLPYLVTRAFEVMAAHRGDHPITHKQRLACIGNCGFPEPQHLALSLEVCQEFARAAGIIWYGALAIGEGGVIDGAGVDAILGRARHQVHALDMMAASLINDEPIPGQAVELAARPMIPHRMYTLLGTIGWNVQAHQNRARAALYATPYEHDEN